MNKFYSIPEDPNTKIWRYFDFAKFVSLLDSQSLFFSRSDLLGDDHEFTYPKSNFNAFDGTPQNENNHFFQHTLKVLRKSIFVNCWHVNNHESTAMWHEYLKNDNGLAIQSTFNRLSQCLQSCEYKSRLDIGMVNYADYDVDMISGGNVLEFIFHKRIQFEHEKELRAVIWKATSNDSVIDPSMMSEPESAEPGLVVPIALDNLIDRIIVAPSAPSWFTPLVEAVCAKYGVKSPITQSSLSEAPLL